MHTFCKLTMSGYLAIIPKTRNICKALPFLVHSIVFSDNSSPSTFSLGFMIGDKLFCCRSVFITVINYHSRNNKAIGNFGVTILIITVLIKALFFPLAPEGFLGLLAQIAKLVVLMLLGVTVLRVSLGRMRIDQAFRFFLKWPLALSVLSLAIVAFA